MRMSFTYLPSNFVKRQNINNVKNFTIERDLRICKFHLRLFSHFYFTLKNYE